MVAPEPSVVLHLAPKAAQRLLKAAEVSGESAEQFTARVTDEQARNVLLDWAVARYHQGDITYGLVAEETGLTIEEIMYAMGDIGLSNALDTFLARADELAEEMDNTDLPRLARDVAAMAREESRRLRAWKLENRDETTPPYDSIAVAR